MNIVRYLDIQAERVPDRMALAMNVDGQEKTVSFSELRNKTAVFASAMKNCGLQPGDRAILMIPMSIELYVAMLGLIRMGATVIFIDPWIKHRQIAQFAAFAEAKAFIGIGKSHLLRLLDKTLLKLPITVTTGSNCCGFPAKYSMRQLMKTEGDYSIYECKENDSALITFTSGSSGMPKGTNRTHGFLTAQHEALQHEFKYLDDDVDMPMFPVFALNNLAAGISSVIPDMDFRKVAEVEPENIYRQIEKYSVTTATASPPFFTRLAEYGNKNYQFRRLLTGGAPVSVEQLKLLRSVWGNTEVQVVFGSTEAEPVAHLSLEKRLEIEGQELSGYCVGKPIKAVNAGVVPITRESVEWEQNMDELFLSQGEIGELVVSGKHVCSDYFRNLEAVKQNKIRDSKGVFWHRMGDTGYFDKDGYFYLVGRVHSSIFSNNGVIHAQLVEKNAQVICSGKVALIALPDEGNYEKVALVVCQNYDDELKQNLLALPEIQEVIFTDKTFPTDPRHNSKTDYSALKQMIIEGNI